MRDRIATIVLACVLFCTALAGCGAATGLSESASVPISDVRPLSSGTVSPTPTPTLRIDPSCPPEEINFTPEEALLYFAWLYWGKEEGRDFAATEREDLYIGGYPGEGIDPREGSYQATIADDIMYWEGEFLYTVYFSVVYPARPSGEALGMFFINVNNLKMWYDFLPDEGRINRAVERSLLVEFLQHIGKEDLTEEVLAQYEEDENGTLWPYGRPTGTPEPTAPPRKTPAPTSTPDPAWGKRVMNVVELAALESQEKAVRYSKEECLEMAARTLAAGGAVETGLPGSLATCPCVEYAGAPGCRLILVPGMFWSPKNEPWAYGYEFMVYVEDASQLREGAVPPPEGPGKEYQTEENEEYTWNTKNEFWYILGGRALDYGLFEPGQEIQDCVMGAATGRLYYNAGMGYYEDLWLEGVEPGGD